MARKKLSDTAIEINQMTHDAFQEALARNPRVARFMTGGPKKSRARKKQKTGEQSQVEIPGLEDSESERDDHQPEPRQDESPAQEPVLDNGEHELASSDIEMDAQADKENTDPKKNPNLSKPGDYVEPTAVEIIFHPHTTKPAQPTGRGRPSKTPKEEYIPRAPFSLAADKSYAAFQVGLAAALTCSIFSIQEDRISWRKKAPANSTVVLLGKEIGFRSMMEEMKSAKEGSRSVMLFMPPPRQLQSSDIDSESTFETTTITDSIAAQQATFDETLQVQIEALQKEYPTSNHPLFPSKRIYTNEAGHCWELNQLRMHSWANHIAKGTATVKKPPPVLHFDSSQRIKKMPQAPPPEQPATIPVAPTTAVTTASSGILGSSLQLTDLLAIGLMSQMLGNNTHAIGAAFPALAQALPIPATGTASVPAAPVPVPAKSLPPSPIVSLNVEVPLDRFCQHYRLSDEVKAGLSKLGYIPGDPNVRKVSEVDWREYAGIPPLMWSRVLDCHRRFVEDARQGVWDEYTIT